MSQLEREIEEQAEILGQKLSQGWAPVLAAARRIRSFEPQWVVIAARGTSDNAARYAQYLWGSHNQLSVGLALPSLHTLLKTPPQCGRALTVGISQSGQSPDIVKVLEDAKAQGGLTLAITNDVNSPLASVADLCLALEAGEETAVAATKTYTAQLLTIAMLSIALNEGLESAERRNQLLAVPTAINTILNNPQDLDSIAAELSDAQRFVVLGRGFNYSTAFELALKMKETSYVMAEPYSIADLLHGPVAMIEEQLPVILVAPSSSTLAGIHDVIRILEDRNVKILALSDQDQILDRVRFPIRLPADLPEWISPIVSIIPGQQWAVALARAKQCDPDQPRGLSKVTLTR